MNIFWIGVAENDATVRGVHFRNVLAIETLFYFRNFAKTLSIINRKQEFATLLGILSRLVHVSFHTPRCNEREIVLSKHLLCGIDLGVHFVYGRSATLYAFGPPELLDANFLMI